MSDFINTIIALFYSLAPSIVAFILGITFYAAFPNWMGLVVFVLLLLLAIPVGVKIFRKVTRIGFVEFVSLKNRSADLDLLIPTDAKNVFQRSPQDLVHLVNENKHLCKGGSLRMFGDWFGPPYRKVFNINTINYNEEESVLTISFDKGITLTIINPKHIYEATTYLKIIDADRITLRGRYFQKDKRLQPPQSYYIDYHKIGNNIKTETDLTSYIPNFDVSFSDPALMVFG
jgi:hypothetical protein